MIVTRRDVTHIKDLVILAARHIEAVSKVARLSNDESASILAAREYLKDAEKGLERMDARTGRRDPSVRKSAKKVKP